MSIFTRTPNWEDDVCSEVRRLLVTAFESRAACKSLLRSSNETFFFELYDNVVWERATAVDFWTQILEKVAAKLRMAQFLEFVQTYRAPLRDPLRALLEEYQNPAPSTSALRGAVPTWSLIPNQHWVVIADLLTRHVLGTPDEASRLETWIGPDLASRLPAVVAEKRIETLIEQQRENPIEDEDDHPPILGLLQGMIGDDDIAAEPTAVFLRSAEANLVRWLRNRGPRNPVDELILKNGEVFLDRSPLRQRLKNLLGRRTVLNVNGRRDLGKSYTYTLIRHIAGDYGFRIAKATHEDASTPEELVEALRLSIPAPAPYGGVDADEAKRLRNAARWLVNEALKAHPAWWFVLDGFNEERITGPLGGFVSALAYFIAQHEAGSLRLVMLDYQGSFPPEARYRRDRDEEVLQAPSQRVVREFFVDFVNDPNRNVPEAERTTHAEVMTRRAWEKATQREAAQRDSRTSGATERRKPFLELLNEEVEEIVDAYI